MQSKIRLYVLGLYILMIPFDNFRLLPFSMSFVMGCIFLLLTIDKTASFSKQRLLEMFPFFLSFLCFVIASLLFWQDSSLKRGTDSFFNTTLLYLVMIGVTTIVSSEQSNLPNFRKIVYFIFVSTLIASCTGFYELISVLFYQRFPFGTAFIQYFGLMNTYILRIRGSYFDPNYFSVIPLLCIVSGNYLFNKSMLKVLLNVVLSVLVLSTFSRMGIVCLITYYCFWLISKRMLYRFIVPIAVLLLPTLVFQLTQFSKSLLEFNPNSVDHRFQIIELSINMVLSNPLFGYGFNVKSPLGLEAHNTYLQVLMYGGLIGFVLIFIPIMMCYVNILRVKPEGKEQYQIRRLLVSIGPPFFMMIFFLSYLTVKFFWIFILLFFLGKNKITSPDQSKTVGENNL